MKNKVVTVLGGSGFVGRYVVSRLAQQGALIKIGCRNINRAIHLLPMGKVGQIKLVPTNVRDEASLENIIQGSDAVVNLVGIFAEKGKQTFKTLHEQAPQIIAKVVKEARVPKFVHLSSIKGKGRDFSRYTESKSKGEERIIATYPNATILKSSLIYGPEDKFFNKYAELTRISPFLLLIGGGKTKFQPVYVGDVADALVEVLRKDFFGETFELGGPECYTFKQLMQVMQCAINRDTYLISIPFFAGYAVGAVCQLFPNPFLTIDQVKLLKMDSVLSYTKPGFLDLGIQVKALEAIIPTYLRRFRKE